MKIAKHLNDVGGTVVEWNGGEMKRQESIRTIPQSIPHGIFGRIHIAKLHLYAAPRDRAYCKYLGSQRFESLSVESGLEGEAGTWAPLPKDENSIPYAAELAPYTAIDDGPE